MSAAAGMVLGRATRTQGRPSDPDRLAREQALVSRARAGDVAAFEQLYRENVGRVYALCCRLTADPALAEELTQDVFVHAWEKLATFRGESAFGSWLHPMATNIVLSERRARRRREARVTTTDDLTPFEPTETREKPELAVDLERALGSLPPGARSVFVLHDVEGLRHEEIAQREGIVAGTSKAQLHRARRLLREALGRR